MRICDDGRRELDIDEAVQCDMIAQRTRCAQDVARTFVVKYSQAAQVMKIVDDDAGLQYALQRVEGRIQAIRPALRILKRSTEGASTRSTARHRSFFLPQARHTFRDNAYR
jgi:hypothetical protein